jgi:valyl-tRNA synthetase
MAAWPRAKKAWFDAAAEKQISFLQQLVIAVRNLRAEAGLPPGKRVPVVVRGTEEQLALIESLTPQIMALARVDRVTAMRDGGRPGMAASAIVDGAEVFLPLEGLIDVAEERARLVREADKLLHDLEGTRRKLRNQDFLNKARPDVVEREHQRLAQLEETLEKLKRTQESLRGAGV